MFWFLGRNISDRPVGKE